MAPRIIATNLLIFVDYALVEGMNWKKLLKITAISVSSLIIVFGILGVWLLTKLPGPSQVKQVLNSSASKLEEKAQLAEAKHPTKIEDTYAAEENQAMQEPSAPAEASTHHKTTKMDMYVIMNDLANPEAPVVSACRDLARAGESGFFPKRTDRTAVKFLDSIVKPQKDPVLESVAPFLRYVFRAPGVREMIQLSQNAQGDDSLFQKAEFYKEAYRAANFLRNNTQAMNQVVQKSYNLHMFAKAVALNPQLANDNAAVTFCEQMEKSLTENQNLNVEEQVQEMQKFLQDAGIDAKSIGFDPKYRAHVQSEFSKNSLMVTDSWLKELVSKGMF
ncbi:hypothetical protein ACLSU7_02920 [Bdellovibrio sp. HCB185ZH]|uniref:hypothetical protein n=1 Tax=Bdellovibrio sp. HCB185ZH TaxID=3394235 RepID=UPI0039A62116